MIINLICLRLTPRRRIKINHTVMFATQGFLRTTSVSRGHSNNDSDIVIIIIQPPSVY
jgi:hypothetical protein